MNQLKQSEISDCFFIGKTKRNIMEKREITWNIYSKDKVKESKGE
nr:MAG TPA: hypothetical protein [Caudoviricetes sp.]